MSRMMAWSEALSAENVRRISDDTHHGGLASVVPPDRKRAEVRILNVLLILLLLLILPTAKLADRRRESEQEQD
jgi:hypothetical protein